MERNEIRVNFPDDPLPTKLSAWRRLERWPHCASGWVVEIEVDDSNDRLIGALAANLRPYVGWRHRRYARCSGLSSSRQSRLALRGSQM
jgi:hypothetical protein